MIGERSLSIPSSNGAHPDNGLVATLAGITADLLPDDTLAAAPDVLLSGMLNGFGENRPPQKPATNGNGRPNSASSQNGGSLSDPVTIACDAAKAHFTAKNSAIAVAICSAADSPQESWEQSLSLASRRNLPLIVVCIHGPQSAPPPIRATKGKNPQALVFGVPVITVDAHDVVAVYRVASESIARARQRRGPSFIESVTSTPLVPTANRDQHRDAISAMEVYLGNKGLFPAGTSQKIAAGLRRQLQRATVSQSN